MKGRSDSRLVAAITGVVHQDVDGSDRAERLRTLVKVGDVEWERAGRTALASMARRHRPPVRPRCRSRDPLRLGREGTGDAATDVLSGARHQGNPTARSNNRSPCASFGLPKRLPTRSGSGSRGKPEHTLPK